MSTAPVPDMPAPPGMCPGVAVEGPGDASGAGGGAGGKGGPGDGGAGGNQEGDAANGGQQGAPNPDEYKECGTASHPVDVVTGRAFTHPIEDFRLGGPLPFVFTRSASSTACRRDFGLGWTWGHTLGWEIEIRRKVTRVWGDRGVAVDFPRINQGDIHVGQWGWLIRREAWGYAVDTGDGLWRIFSTEPKKGRRYRLTAIEDRNKNRIVLVYDERGILLREVHDSAGRTIRVRTDARGRIAQFLVQNAASQGQWVALATYEHDLSGCLIKATDADGFSSLYAYDNDHRLTKDQDRTGLTFHFRFDKSGRCKESWGEYAGRPDPSLATGLPATLADHMTPCRGIHHCTFQYFDNGYSVVTDSTQARNFTGNRHGLVEDSQIGGVEEKNTYRSDGHRMSFTDGEGATTEWKRDRRGMVMGIIDPLMRETLIERDDTGLPIRVVDPAKGEILITRDVRGNILSVRDEAGGLTQFAHDSRGLVTKVIDAMGGVTLAVYDQQGDRTSITQADGSVWHYTYDFAGRLTSIQNPLASTLGYSYSPRGDLVLQRDALGNVTRYQYDGEGHLISVQGPKGHTTKLIWGGYHRLCIRVDANGHAVRLGYDVEGDLTHVWDPSGEVHRLRYTPAGLLSDELTIDKRHLHYKHDKCGRPIHVRGGDGRVTELMYDAAGQLLVRIGFDGSTEAFEYDLRGELQRAVSSDGIEIAYDRDPTGRIIREVQAIGGVAHEVSIARDAMGKRIGRKTSLGHIEQVVRDRMGDRRRTTLDGHVIDQTPNAIGQELRRTLMGGGFLESAFDADQRLVQRRSVKSVTNVAVVPGQPEWVGAQPLGVTANEAFRYDADGELVESHDLTQGRTEYRYDPVAQLLSKVPEKARAELFKYDANGNPSEAAAGDPSRSYGPGNRLLRLGNIHFTWDADGRLIGQTSYDETQAPGDTPREAWRYQWNAAGLMSRAECSDGTVVELFYDVFARRLEKRVGKISTNRLRVEPEARVRFVWDGEALVHEIRERAADGLVEERTYWFEDDGYEPFAHCEKRVDELGRESGGWFHYLNDPIGTPEKLIDENGEVATEYRKTAWGQLEVVGPARASTPFRLLGQYYDEELDLSYQRWRYVGAQHLFTAPDPLGIIAGPNAYRLLPNAQVYVDPLGLDWNYRIQSDPNNPNSTYYYGRASDNQSPADVVRRHADSGRMGPGDALVQITPQDTNRAATRGVEQAGIERGGPGNTSTMTGTRGCTGNRGNVIPGVAPGRTDSRAVNYRRQGSRTLGGTNPRDLPPLGTSQIGNPAPIATKP